MKEQGISTAWWESIKTNGQDPWEKLRDNDPHNQMKQFKLINGQRVTG
jgi:hypothetical protein